MKLVHRKGMGVYEFTVCETNKLSGVTLALFILILLLPNGGKRTYVDFEIVAPASLLLKSSTSRRARLLHCGEKGKKMIN